jgi:hypothetical protein
MRCDCYPANPVTAEDLPNELLEHIGDCLDELEQ